MINRIASSKVGVLVAHLNDPSKSPSLLNKDPGVKQLANEVKDAWTKAQQQQKITGRLPGDLASALPAKPPPPPLAAPPPPPLPTFASLPSFDMVTDKEKDADVRGSGKRKLGEGEESEEKRSKKEKSSKDKSEKRKRGKESGA